MGLSDDDIAEIYKYLDGFFIKEIVKAFSRQQTVLSENKNFAEESYCERCTVHMDPDGRVHVCVKYCEKLLRRNCGCINAIEEFRNIRKTLA